MQVTAKGYEVYPGMETTQHHEKWKEEDRGRTQKYIPRR